MKESSAALQAGLANIGFTTDMDEARKTNAVRAESFKTRFLSGRVIDIGCGPDLVIPTAIPFDVEHGDAQSIGKYFAPESFDSVHSSHCLEHMRDPATALGQWWSLVKQGGYMVIVVPDEDLYEQGMWPSVFNSDHKATFNIGKQSSWSPVSHDIQQLVRSLPDAEVIETGVQDDGYDHTQRSPLRSFGRLLLGFGRYRERLFAGLARRGAAFNELSAALDRVERLAGKPVDQTLGPALAQIQIVARKSRVDF